MKKIAEIGALSYLAAFAIFCLAYFEHGFSVYFSWLPPSPFAGFLGDWGEPVFLVGMISIVGVTLALSKKENIQKYDPKDRKVRISAIRAGLFGAGTLVAAYFFSASFVFSMPPLFTVITIVILIFTGIHFLLRAALTPVGLYPWRFLPRRLLAQRDV